MLRRLRIPQKLLNIQLWKEIGSVISQEVKEAQVLLRASALAYTTILSLVPLLAVSFAIFQAFGGLDKLYSTIQPFIIENLSEGVNEKAAETIQSFISNARASALGIGGFIGLLFTSFSMLSSVEKAINQLWRTPINRSWFHRISSYWLFITLGPLGLAVAVGLATSSQFPLHNFLPNGTGLFVLSTLFFFAVYQFIPSCNVHWRYSLIAGMVTTCFWGLARVGFGVYVKKVVTYDKVYGSLGAIPILLLWIYLVWIIILSGAALSAALQRRLGIPSPSKLTAKK